MNEEWPGQRLHQFAIFDREDCMIDILQGDEKLNINASDRCGRTPVYTAVSNNSIKCLEILLQHGADPSIPGGERVNFMTPLHQALLEGKEDAIKLLLRYGADLNKEDRSGYSPVNLAHGIADNRYIKLFEAEKERRYTNALSVVKDLCDAVEEGDLDKIKDIIRLPAPIGWELANMVEPGSNDKKTALVVAAMTGNIVIMTELLNTVAVPKPSPSLIHTAIEAGHIDIVKILLEGNLGQLLPYNKIIDWSKLKELADNNRFPECCKVEDDRHFTPLHKACQTGSLEMVKCLMEWNYPDNLYRTLYNMEENISYRMVLHVNAKTSEGKTPLYLACEDGHDSIVEYLLNFTVAGRKGDHDRASLLSSENSLTETLSSKHDSELPYKPVEIGMNDHEAVFGANVSMNEDDSVVQYRPTKVHHTDNYTLSCIYIAVKNQHHLVVDKLVAAGTDLSFITYKDGKKFSTLLLLALENNDLLMLDKIMKNGVEDVDNNVLQRAVRKAPELVPHFLKYKSSEDKYYSINKNQMKREYLESIMVDKIDGYNSIHPKYQETFPVQPVMVRWQNLNVLNTVETSWLICVANLCNPKMSNVNMRIPLFAITKVDVSHNCLTMIPSCLLQLPSLCVLSVANNKITGFPTLKHFTIDCQSLEDLDIQCNEIEAIPSYIFELSSLRALHAGKNKIKDLPSSIWQSYSLKSVDLSDNKLEQLPFPDWLDYMSDIRGELETQSILSEDSLNQPVKEFSIADQIETSLRRANHWSRSLEIADGTANITKCDQKGLKLLKLGRNKISEFPEFLSCCAPFLETLDLSRNRLGCLGNLACYPMFLRSLDVSLNQITTMEDWQQVEEGGRCFSTWMGGHSASTELVNSRTDQLHSRPLSAVPFSATCGHRKHTKLANLETLDLSMNKITSLILLRSELKKDVDITSSIQSLKDKEQMEQDLQGRLLFPNLMSLSIYSNQLSDLPDEIGQLKVLRILSLKKNMNLKQLPPTLGLLDKLHRIEVELCPLEGPIQDVIKGAANKATDITGFLRSVLEESEEYNCMNLMLVGSHNIGKTTLLEHLARKGFLPRARSHFVQRQDASSGRGTTQDGRPLSTVGIDINRLVFEGRQGRVEFRTWDFAGQKEYYATHQYFLRPRSLYLAVWNLKDGLPGVDGLRQWLVNIQAQAPGAPVIIVGTHLDQVIKAKKNYPKDWDESMIDAIRDKYMKIDHGYVGLPKVLDAINVSCGKKDMKVDKLRDMIYDKVFTLTHPERKSEKLLGHKVPKKYIDLQKCLENIVKERMEKNREPVLDGDSYLLSVMNEMSKDGSKTFFRNKEDLYQATRFLHENGVLCHFADTSLKDQYFLEPQWLCDQLAKVVSIQEVQKYSSEGVMKVRDLYKLYRNSDRIGQYILGLLNKFEVAIQFDEDHLLLPSLLPTDKNLEPARMKEIAIKRQGADIRTNLTETVHSVGNSLFYKSLIPCAPAGEMSIVCSSAEKNPAMSNTRLYLLTYFPSGFWPRLITRILADDTFNEPVMRMFSFPQEVVDKCCDLQRSRPCWRCWQTGIELVYFGNVIFQVKELRTQSEYARGMCDYDNEELELQCFFDDAWSQLDIKDSSMLEISFQADHIIFNFGFQESGECQHFQSVESSVVYHDERAKASILAKFVEHIDGLLQDWFPEIGESRFMQSYTGRFLVTRVIPCPMCLHEESTYQKTSPNTWEVYTTNSDQPRSLSVSTPGMSNQISENNDTVNLRLMYTFLVERCVKNVLEGMDEVCLKHRAVSSTFMPTENGETRTLYLAPDLVFQDLESSIMVSEDLIEIGRRLGRGAFGIVSAGKLTRGGNSYDVAVKVMFDPEDRKKLSSQMSLETMCLAYTMARQECAILQTIEHPNIVPLMGLSRRPLALLLALAPHGSLNTSLDYLYNNGLNLQSWVIKQIVVQISDALDYLHGRNIIYRDLKSDNVLVWNLPSPKDVDLQKTVLVKLADYGISRSVSHAGAKGFGGTPPFIAPEILVHAGKGIYTEKVDIFSFGMFMFELLTCRQPLKEISNPTLHVSHGGRPSLTSEEATYPSHMLDLMTICWAQEPNNRPSAAQVKRIASSPQFCHLSDAVTMETKSYVLSACTVFVEETSSGSESGLQTEQTQCWIVSKQGFNFNVEILYYNLQNKHIGYKELQMENSVISVCTVQSSVWCLDSMGRIIIYDCETLDRELEYQLPVNHVSMVRTMKCYHDNQNNHICILLQERGDRQQTIFHLCERDIRSQNGNLVAAKLKRDCFCATIVYSHERLKLWLGSNNSEILVMSLDNLEAMTDVHCLCPHQVPVNTQSCMFICASYSNHGNHFIWSYNYPGTKVYLWDTDKEIVLSSVDCERIMPISECTIQKPRKHDAAKCQVTALSVIGQYLYIATTGGCIIVTDSSSLQAYSAFRCHSDEDFYCKAILPLGPTDSVDVLNNTESDAVQTDINTRKHSGTFQQMKVRNPGILTIGRGYVDLVSHVTRLEKQLIVRQDSDDGFSMVDTETVRAASNTVPPDKSARMDTHVLSWIAEHWEHF